jgi:hypothetical protein
MSDQRKDKGKVRTALRALKNSSLFSQPSSHRSVPSASSHDLSEHVDSDPLTPGSASARGRSSGGRTVECNNS